MLHHFAPAEQYEVDRKVAMMIHIEKYRHVCLYTSIILVRYTLQHAQVALMIGNKWENIKLTFLKCLKSSASFITSNTHSPEMPLFLFLLLPPITNMIPVVVKKLFPSL